MQNGCDSTRTVCLLQNSSATREKCREVLHGRALFPTVSTKSLWHSLAFLPHSMALIQPCFSSRVTSILHDASLTNFYCPLGYNSRAHCPILQCLRTISVILAGAHSYFVVQSFKCEGKDSCHDLYLCMYI